MGSEALADIFRKKRCSPCACAGGADWRGTARKKWRPMLRGSDNRGERHALPRRVGKSSSSDASSGATWGLRARLLAPPMDTYISTQTRMKAARKSSSCPNLLCILVVALFFITALPLLAILNGKQKQATPVVATKTETTTSSSSSQVGVVTVKNSLLEVTATSAPLAPLFAFRRMPIEGAATSTFTLRRIWEGIEDTELEELAEDPASTLTASAWQANVGTLSSHNGKFDFNVTLFPLSLSAKTRFAQVDLLCSVEQEGLAMRVDVIVAHYTWVDKNPARVLVMEWDAIDTSDTLTVTPSSVAIIKNDDVDMVIQQTPRASGLRTYVMIPFVADTDHLQYDISVSL